jgi:hypothetical protein
MTGLGDIDLFDILILKARGTPLGVARCYHPEACRAVRPLDGPARLCHRTLRASGVLRHLRGRFGEPRS